MASWGMIGLVGGLGAGLKENAAFLAKQEEADATAKREKDFQGWLMAKREEYAIEGENRQDKRTIAGEDRAYNRTKETEQRAEDRGERVKDKDFGRLKVEAPTRRGIKAEDVVSEHRAKSGAAYATREQDAEVTRVQTDAKQTPEEVAERGARTDLLQAQAEEALRKARAVEARMSDGDKGVRDSLKEKIKAADKIIMEGQGNNTWDEKNLTAAQRQLVNQRNIAVRQLNDLADKYRSQPGTEAPAANADADPAAMRGRPATSAATTPAPGPRLRADGKPTLQQPGDADRDRIWQQEHAKEVAKIAAEKDPEQLARFQRNLVGIESEMTRHGIPIPAKAAVTAPPATQPQPAGAVAPAAAAPAQPPASAPAQRGQQPAQALQTLVSAAGPGGQPAPAAGGAPAAAAPGIAPKVEQVRAAMAAPAATVDPVLQALGGAGNNGIGAVMAQKVPALRAAADRMRAAQAQVVSAANSQQQGGVAQAMQQVSAAMAEVDGLLRDMNPPQAQAVKKALGL